MLPALVFWISYAAMILWLVGLSFWMPGKDRMTGMAMAMSVGMVVGFGLGTFLAAVFHVSFFAAAWVGGGTGAAIGWLIGLSSGVAGVLDGFLSGLMGGFMGAMMAVMVPLEYQETMFRLTSVVSAAALFLSFLLVSRKNKETVLAKKKWWLHPASFFLLTGLFLTLNHVYPFGGVGSSEHFPHNERKHHAEGSSKTKNVGGKSVIIFAEEYRFSPKRIQLKMGEPVEIRLKNTGTTEHDFKVRNGREILLHIHARPGEEVVRTFIPDQTGMFISECILPGHREKGMIGVVSVVGIWNP